MPSFVPIPGMASALAHLAGVKDHMEEAADAVKQEAESIAPYDVEGNDRFVDTQGHYRDAFEVVVDEETGETRLVNTNFKAHWIEWGTVRMPAQAVIRRAVASVGYKLQEASKPR